MTAIVANTSPLIPFQFPKFYQEDYPNFIGFVQAYYQWLEQPNNALYYARRIYQIKDIDTTFDQFVVYFKEKYLKNIQFTTATEIRTVIKHALDIYRSKGTERCTTLIFQLAFNTRPAFYYPSTDLFKLSDGTWRILNYLELNLQWDNNIAIQNKEVQGVFSGATAFVDSIIRRTTNGRLEDVAYISAINGQFIVGEKVIPLDGSLPVAQCPSIMGSLVGVQFTTQGTGQNYVLGSDLSIASFNGQAGIFQVSNTINQSGVVTSQFIDGGWGYSLTYPTANIQFTANVGAIANSIDIFSYYANGTQAGQGYITANSANSFLTVLPLSGNLQIGNAIYTFANAASMNVLSFATTYATPNVWISNTTLYISNVQMTTSNLELGQFFGWGDVITEPLATLNYILANGTFVVGANIYTWSAGSMVGNGVIIQVNPANSSAGVLVVSVAGTNVATMNVSNAVFTSANAIGANLTAANGFTNSTATGHFIANSSQVTLNITASNGAFIAGEQIFQYITNEGPLPNFKVGGWGYVYRVPNTTTVVVNNVFGRFTSFGGLVHTVFGGTSGATANVLSAGLFVGVVNVSSSPFIASNNAWCYGAASNGYISQAAPAGTGFTLTIANSLSSQANIQVNVDTMNTYSAVLMNATSYGFPALPTANSSNGTMASSLNMLNLTVGKINSIDVTGLGQNYLAVPFIVVDQPQVSQYYLYNDILWTNNTSGSFGPNEVITQAATGAQGQITNLGNTTFLEVQRQSFANDFIPTSNSTTQIVGTSTGTTANIISVDYDYLNTMVMGRNVAMAPLFSIGNNAVSNGTIISSGFGFVNGDVITIGSNGAVGTAVIGGVGVAPGYYDSKGGFLSDQKKLFDGWFYQNFSYQIISSLMLDKYNAMMQELSHVSGTILFGAYVHNSVDGSALQANMVSFNSQTYGLFNEADIIQLTDETGTIALTSW